jgi:hypothetical protein
MPVCISENYPASENCRPEIICAGSTREKLFESGKPHLCSHQAGRVLFPYGENNFRQFSAAGDFSLVTFCPCSALDAEIAEKKVTPPNNTNLTI